MTLVGTLAGTVALSFAVIAFFPERTLGVLELLGAIFGPLVALVGAATGYYFGAQSASGREQSINRPQ